MLCSAFGLYLHNNCRDGASILSLLSIFYGLVREKRTSHKVPMARQLGGALAQQLPNVKLMVEALTSDDMVAPQTA